MPCYGPLTAFFSREVSPKTGKRGITFKRDASFSGVSFKVPCGRCIGCKLEIAREWRLRCIHEQRMHNRSAFVTLTYDNDFVPDNGFLVKSHLQKFMKRLRHVHGDGLRFYGCGEYGDDNERPHYHVLLLNSSFDDGKFYKNNERGEPLYTSATLSKLWPMGISTFGACTNDSIGYVARYVTKKISGEKADEHYMVRDADGVIYVRPTEFTCMSVRPGLGTSWYEKYGRESYFHDNCVVDGSLVPLPRFYDNKLKLVDAARLKLLKSKRKRLAVLNKADNSTSRLRVKEVIALSKLSQLRRVI